MGTRDLQTNINLLHTFLFLIELNDLEDHRSIACSIGISKRVQANKNFALVQYSNSFLKPLKFPR